MAKQAVTGFFTSLEINAISAGFHAHKAEELSCLASCIYNYCDVL